jgi:uncharacterized membrane protein YhaH (DUF805 family)
MHWYLQALKKYAVFSGRSQRKEYWMFILFNTLISCVLVVMDILTGTAVKSVGLGALGGLYALAIIIPSFAIAVRRLHDIGRSGWWVLIPLIPLIGGIVFLVFALTDGTPGDNRYGPNPKGLAASSPA